MKKTPTTTTTTSTRKNTPKVTNKQRRMTDAEKAAWKVKIKFDTLPAELQTSIDAKLIAPLTVRTGNGKAVKSYDADWAKSLTVMQVMSVKFLIEEEYKARETERTAERAKLTEKIAALQQQADTMA